MNKRKLFFGGYIVMLIILVVYVSCFIPAHPTPLHDIIFALAMCGYTVYSFLVVIALQD